VPVLMMVSGFGARWAADSLSLAQPLAYLRSAIYSDTNPEPKTHPNAVIRIFELSLYYAGLNK